MVKKILVPTDGSEYSRRAMSTAIQYAKALNSEIELLYVISEHSALKEDYPLSEEQVTRLGTKVFGATLEGLEPEQIQISKKIVTGYPASEILNETAQNVDLVIMGSRGHRPIKGALLGSVTLRVIAAATCPVMVVK